MSKYEKIVVALLGAIAICSAVTAVEVATMVRNGFNIEITMADAEEIAENVNEAIEAREAAEEDMVDYD